jgi:hypothetical protein
LFGFSQLDEAFGGCVDKGLVDVAGVLDNGLLWLEEALYIKVDDAPLLQKRVKSDDRTDIPRDVLPTNG